VAAGESGLLHATTGSGKTYAVWFAALGQVLAQALSPTSTSTPASTWRRPGLKLLWITPMRALASDTTRALSEPLAELDIDWRVGLRTGDTPAAERARQDKRLPDALVTTPESLSLMLALADTLGAAEREALLAQIAAAHPAGSSEAGASAPTGVRSGASNRQGQGVATRHRPPELYG
jgi:ATP-dependent Lhr-like helicase